MVFQPLPFARFFCLFVVRQAYPKSIGEYKLIKVFLNFFMFLRLAKPVHKKKLP
jgi:hypothetical protein